MSKHRKQQTDAFGEANSIFFLHHYICMHISLCLPQVWQHASMPGLSLCDTLLILSLLLVIPRANVFSFQ